MLDRLRRCLKLFISTVIPSSHEFASQFGLAHFLQAKNTQKLSQEPNRHAGIQLNDPATRRKGVVTVVEILLTQVPCIITGHDKK